MKSATAIIKFKEPDDMLPGQFREHAWSVGCTETDSLKSLTEHLARHFPKATLISVKFIPDKRKEDAA